MPLSLAVHWELIGVTTPQQLQPKIDHGLHGRPVLKRCQTRRPRSVRCYVCVLQDGEVVVCHSSHSCQGQLGQRPGMEQKASQGAACDLRAEHTHTPPTAAADHCRHPLNYQVRLQPSSSHVSSTVEPSQTVFTHLLLSVTWKPLQPE